MEEIAQVYARSLFEVAQEQDKLDEIREQLGQVSEAIEKSKDLSVFFFSPYFSTKEKQEGLSKVLEDPDPILENFLGALLENHRMPVIHRIRREYDSMWAEENKLLPVQVTSAIELDPDEIRSIGDRIGEQTGRKIDLEAKVDPDILGGVVLRVGNSILDASVRNRLEKLRRQVARGA